MPTSSGQRFYTGARGVDRRGNPYFSGKRDRLAASPVKNTLYRLSPRFWLWFFTTFFITAIVAWLLLWSNVFIIKKVEVRGTILIPPAAIELLASERLESRRAWIFPESRLLVFNSQDFKQDIAERYSFEGIDIVKRLPSTLVIKVTERPAVAVWFEADTYYQIDTQGTILSISDGTVEGLPTIYNNGLPKIVDKIVSDSSDAITFARDLSVQFPLRFPSLTIKQIIIDNDEATLKLLPSKGAMVYFSTKDSLGVQIDRLEILLASELKDRFAKLKYIDLRYGDRVYYK